jgi:hypothetical protein
MTRSNPMVIVRNALAKGELDRLLLGAPEYCYRSRFSPAPGNTDLTELLDVLYDRRTPADKQAVRGDLIAALNRIVGAYEGLEPVATCILYESLRKARDRPTLDLPLDDLADKLRVGVERFRSDLQEDKSGEGREWPDGCLGMFRRLSRNTEQLGGPSFCE